MTVTEEARKFHGDQNYNAHDLMTKLNKKDWKEQKQTIDEYLERFDTETSNAEKRKAVYMKIVNNYYDLVTDFYEYGWGQCFHFCRFFKGEAFDQAIARHEHVLANKMGLKPGMEVLDVGCGIGGPMREIVRFSGASVTGINNNAYQIERLATFNKKAGLSHLARGVKGDFMNMPFENETFDAVYAIEATVHAPTLQGVFEEIYRVLKPGGVFSSYEWLTTAEYDPNNSDHKRIVHTIEEGDGISYMSTIPECLEALKNAGFGKRVYDLIEIVEYEDLAKCDTRFEDPWYSTLQGGPSLRGFRMSSLGRWTTDKLVYAMETVGFAPPGSRAVSQLLNRAADALVEGGEKEIFTPMFFYKVVKPL